MPEMQIEDWAGKTVSRTWPGALAAGIAAIKGDASGRRFWRITLDGVASGAPHSAIAVDLGPDDVPLCARALGCITEPVSEPLFINVHRFLKSIGAAVPDLYYQSLDERMLLAEDLGTLSLFDAAIAATRRRAAELFRAAIDQLLIFHCDGTRRADSSCIAFKVAYDERLFRWELEHFVEFGLLAAGLAPATAHLERELDRLAATLGALPRIFAHRDYHGRNLFVQDGAIRVIDFQDALMAPHAQDLAVLLTTRDTARTIKPPIEERLLNYYFASLERRGAKALNASEFMRSYWLCVLQHALKVIGRFALLERNGRDGYARYIPDALEQARRALARLDDFPELGQAMNNGPRQPRIKYG
ncbi:MAG: aminoglycoside phosphotransferase family protein [Candidatus Binataceae bacterium]